MLNQDFLNFLEFHLSRAFSYSPDKSVRSLWCDGILLPHNPNAYSKKTINDKREVEVKAYIGKDGQGDYSMIIRFGRKALSRYARDLDLTPCVPGEETTDWYEIDTNTNKITIQLF